jgi:hypothetical protein
MSTEHENNEPQHPSYPLPAPPEPAGYGTPPPGYPAYGYYPAPYPLPRNEPMAVASLVLAVTGLATCGLTAVIGAIFGHIARKRIRAHAPHLEGDGLAQAGIIIGWIIGAIGIAYWVFILVIAILGITGVIE